MKLCALGDVREDMVLGKSIYQANGRLLLGAGYRLTAEMLGRLRSRGYAHIYIMEEGTEEVIPQDIISEEIRLKAQAKLTGKVEEVKRRTEFQDMSYHQAIELLEEGYLKDARIAYEMRKIVEEIFRDISEVGSTYMSTIMIKSRDTYFLDHAINTTILSILIGNKYRFDKSELISLALGTFLHDIGKIIIEQLKGSDDPKIASILYKEHPTFGFLLLSDSNGVSPIEKQIVNQHHENQDGSGFPIGLSGQNLPPIKAAVRETKGSIYRLAEICCVTNVFDNMLLNPTDRQQLTPPDVIKYMVVRAGDIFNKDIIGTLVRVVPCYPVGTQVRIVTIGDTSLIGYLGVVAKVNEDNINKPIVVLTANKKMQKIKPILIDTSKMKNVELEMIL